jgi:hypothetical protein
MYITEILLVCLRNIIEKSFTVNRKVYIAFVDLLKAFDNKLECNDEDTKADKNRLQR